MNILSPPLECFVGHFAWISPLCITFWILANFVALVIGILKKIRFETKNIILSYIFTAGIILFVWYLSFALSAYTNYIPAANALGGLSPSEKQAYFEYFNLYFHFQTAVIISCIIFFLFIKFSLLPYDYYQRKKETNYTKNEEKISKENNGIIH